MRVNCLVPNVRNPQTRNEHWKHDKCDCVHCCQPVMRPADKYRKTVKKASLSLNKAGTLVALTFAQLTQVWLPCWRELWNLQQCKIWTGDRALWCKTPLFPIFSHETAGKQGLSLEDAKVGWKKVGQGEKTCEYNYYVRVCGIVISSSCLVYTRI